MERSGEKFGERLMEENKRRVPQKGNWGIEQRGKTEKRGLRRRRN